MDYLTEILVYLVIGILIMEMVSFITRTTPNPDTGEFNVRVNSFQYILGLLFWPPLLVAAIIRVILQGRKRMKK
jgi:hypothetical protein